MVLTLALPDTVPRRSSPGGLPGANRPLPPSPPMKPPVAFPPACFLTALLASAVGAAEPPDYVRDVKPLLAKQCVGCHGATKPKAGLRLDTAASALRGNKNGPAVVPGSSDESPL